MTTQENLWLTLCITLIAGSLLGGAAVAAPPSDTAAAETVTWAEHVAPIVFERCVSCHRPEQTAPMSLMSYDEARPWAKSISRVTHEGTMPPWFANPEHGEFVEDPRLSPEQVQMIASWVSNGAPAGDLSKAPQPPVFASGWQLGEPDVTFTMEPFEITDDMEDHYHWAKVENHLDEDRWIQSLEIRPTFLSGTHHQLTYLAPPGSTIAGVQGVGTLDLDFVSGWGPGVEPVAFPEGYGKLLPANSTVFFQMHYHKEPGPGTGGTDQTTIGFRFHDEKPENTIATMWIVDPALNIPPGEANYASASSFTPEHDAVIFDFTPHMHLRGKAMRFTAEYPNGEKEVLLDVDKYDFNWQLTYTSVEPTRIPAGTKIAVDALFDNSEGNLANPDPSITVRFGEKTTDEMMVGFIHYSFVDKEQQADMPTFSVPEPLRQQMNGVQRMRQQQREKAAEQEGTGGL